MMIVSLTDFAFLFLCIGPALGLAWAGALTLLK